MSTTRQPPAGLRAGPSPARDAAVAGIGLVGLLLWDLLPLDMSLSLMVGNGNGFPWREHWLTQGVLHDGGRLVGFFMLALLVLNLRWPLWHGLPLSDRVAWLASTLACIVLVPAIKRFSATSCPWDLQLFGGAPQALHLSHWLWRTSDLGPGGCFPSGHAVSAFAFLSGWFALRQQQAAAARRWLLAVTVLGLLYGAAQLARGAHFASHTLWTAWACWVICAMAWWLRPRRLLRRPAGDPVAPCLRRSIRR